MNAIDDIEARAQRVLDGMTVNREALARDTIKLCQAARRLQTEIVRLDPKRSKGTKRDVLADIFGGGP